MLELYKDTDRCVIFVTGVRYCKDSNTERNKWMWAYGAQAGWVCCFFSACAVEPTEEVDILNDPIAGRMLILKIQKSWLMLIKTAFPIQKIVMIGI